LCNDFLRKQAKRPDCFFVEDRDEAILGLPSIDFYEKQLVRESLHEALASLSEMYRQVLTLHYFVGMKTEEIAQFLRTSPSTIRKRLSRARAKLKKEMLDMMSATFEEQKLQPGFTFRIVEMVKRMRVKPAPKIPPAIPIGIATVIAFLAVGLGMMVGFGISSGIDVAQDMPGIKSVQTPFPVSLASIRDAGEQRIVALQKQQNEEIKSARKSFSRYRNEEGKKMVEPIQTEKRIVAVRVVDNQQRPIHGAVIRLGFLRPVKPHDGGHYRTDELKVMTDAAGVAQVEYPRYVFERVETDEIRFSISHPDYAGRTVSYKVDSSEKAIVMSLGALSVAIRDAYQIVSRAEKAVKEAIGQFGPEKRVEFPNTAYFLPIIYAMTGMEVRTIADMHPVLDKAKMLLPPVPAEKTWLPSLGNTLDAGMATLFASEIIEVLKYLEDPVPYYIGENCPNEGDNYWLGNANDFVYRKRGLNFVDGDCLGFVTTVGCAPTNEIAVKIARELQKKKLYVFMTATADGKNMAEQLRQEGVQMGWDTRLVPFGKDITARVYPLGFAARMAMSWGAVHPGDYWPILLYIRNRTLIRLAANKETDLESLITDTFEFADYERVLNLLEHKKDEYGLGPLLYNVGERFRLTITEK